MAKESFKIPYPSTPAGKKRWAKEYGLNRFYAGVHWSKRKEAAEFWHMMTRAAMNREGVRKRPFEKPVIVRMYFNDHLDSSNHAMYFKFIEDGLVGRLIQNDSRRYVKGSEMYFHDEGYILVEVREV